MSGVDFDGLMKQFLDVFEEPKPTIEEKVQMEYPSPNEIVKECKDLSVLLDDGVLLSEAFKWSLLEFKVDPVKYPWKTIQQKGKPGLMDTPSGKKIKGYIIGDTFFYRGHGTTYAFKDADIKPDDGSSDDPWSNLPDDIKKNGQKASVTTGRNNTYYGYVVGDKFHYSQDGKVRSVDADKLDLNIHEDGCAAAVGTASISSPSKVTGEFPRTAKKRR